ncbi:MAG TPA: helix-turn-helix domain-containing protein [Clostridiales bacterium]|nr:helix-turn-helix domain-containing protein [Clostridiales bacterium]HQP70425.1 helix-turn-helix domain-containing protein [Clostridiales bacterium]
MTRSLIEKLEIVKQAKSKKLIKKLAIQHGITEKTIKNWIALYKAGELNGKKDPDPKSPQKSKKISGPFSESVYKVSLVYSVLKDQTVYRHLLKDINRGFILCAYSSDNSNGYFKEILNLFLSDLKKSGITVKKIITDKRNHVSDLKSTGTILTCVNNTSIKKHLTFTTKHNSFMKERTKYENNNEFLFDSMATTAKNNHTALEKYKAVKSSKCFESVKKLNIKYHSAILSDEVKSFDESRSGEILTKMFDQALEIHKKFDLVNSDDRYRRIEVILKDSGSYSELYAKILIQIGKVYALKKDMVNARKYFSKAMKMAKLLPADKISGFKYAGYMLYADVYRLTNENRKCLYFFEKARRQVEADSNERNKAIFYINYSLFYKNTGTFDKAEEFLLKSEVLAEKNKFDDILLAVKENKADYNVKRGNTSEAIKLYEKMIADDLYKNMFVQKVVLWAKYGDCLQIAGKLSESIKAYDKSVEIIDRSDNPAVLTTIRIPVSGNKAVAYIKMNEFLKAGKIFEDNIELSQKNNLKVPLIDNMLNLCLSEIESGRISDVKSRLSEVSLLLENTDNTSQKYNLPLYNGMISKIEKKFVKAESEILSAIEIAKTTKGNPFPYLKALTVLIELHIESGDFKKAKANLKILNKKADSDSNEFYAYSSVILEKKSDFYKTNKKEAYKIYLQELLKSKLYDTEEQMYFVKKQLELHQV